MMEWRLEGDLGVGQWVNEAGSLLLETHISVVCIIMLAILSC